MTDPLEPIITCDSVSFRFEERWVLKDVAFSIGAGDFVGLIGPNGGGKTTLLKLIMGLLSPTQGRVRVCGQAPKKSRKKMAYVPQRLHFDPSFPISLLEVVMGGQLTKGRWWGPFSSSDRKKAEAMLEKMDLIEHKDSPFGELSGGQAQRGLMARALIAEPEILLLDEPTANVDRRAEESIYSLIHTLKKKMTILMVTHHLPALMQDVDLVFSIQREVVPMEPSAVCEHFGMGVYHPPLKPEGS